MSLRANNKYMKDYDKNKESSNLQYWHENNLYDWVISQKLPVNKFEWIEDLIKISYKNTMKKVMKDISLKLIFNILKKYLNFIMIYYF